MINLNLSAYDFFFFTDTIRGILQNKLILDS